MPSTLSTAISTNGPIVSPFGTGTTLAQDQAKAANQGKTGFDVLGNPLTSSVNSPVTPTNTDNTVKIQPTTLSGDKSSQISDNAQKTNDINNGIAANKTNPTLAGGLEKYNDGSPISAPSDAVQQTDENGNTWWTSGGKNYAVAPDTGLSPENQQSKDILDELQAQSDAAFAGQIASVRQMFDTLINQQKQVNAGREAGNAQSLLEGGTSRYAQESANNNQANEVSKGISDISDLTSKEMSAIATLNSAQMSHNYELASKQLDLVDKIRTDKQKVMDDLQKNIQAGIKDAKDTLQKNNDASNSAIRQVMLEAGKSGSLTPDQNKALQTALANHDYAGAITAAGDSLQTATGQLGDYLQYKKDAIANGLTPTDYATWKAKDDASQSKLKSSEAYATAYATAKGKAAGENADNPSGNMNIPVVSNTGATNGLTFNVPADLAPYAKFSANGTKYVDLSSLTKSDAKDLGEKAILAGYRPIFDTTIAGDLVNITDANDKLDVIKSAFDQFTADNALERNSYKAAFNKIGKALQTDPNVAASGVYEIAALDIIKAVSGMKGGRISVKTIDDLENNFPKATDDKTTADQKIENMRTLMTAREKAAIGEPSASDSLLIQHKQDENNITVNLQKMKTTNPKLYTAASNMYTTNNPETGQPYSMDDILQVYPELSQ